MLQFNFEAGRKTLFSKGYTQLQVDGINAIVAEANEQGIALRAQLAYILGTAYHEAYDYDGKSTGKIQRLVPIKEKGGDIYLKAKKYYPHIGYGYVQITWEPNYIKMRQPVMDKFGVDIVENPELLLRVDIAAFVIVLGMRLGMFTGKKLSDYITLLKTDFPGARAIVNGSDQKAKIAGYASDFLKCIL